MKLPLLMEMHLFGLTCLTTTKLAIIFQKNNDIFQASHSNVFQIENNSNAMSSTDILRAF